MSTYWRVLISLLLLFAMQFAGIPVSAAPQEPPSAISATHITQANIHKAVASLAGFAQALQKKTGVPGIAIAVVRGDKVLYARGFGVRKIGTTLRVDANTVFQLASVSKSLASTVVAGAVGQGRVKWTDPVAKYLPGFTLSDPYVGSHVTIEDMFSHRSGLPDHAGDLLEDLGYSRADVLSRLALEPLDPFRITYHYTNFGLTAAAQAVANAEGMTWSALSQHILYGPLGMTSTSSRWSDYHNNANHATLAVKRNGMWINSSREPDAQSPAGGASSSVNDLAKWMMLELSEGKYHGKQIIDRAALLQTQQPLMLTKPANPPNRGSFYGLGMGVSYDEAGFLRLSHSGAFESGAATTYAMLPAAHLGIVVLTNGEPMGVPEAIAMQFYDVVEFGKVQRDWPSLLFSAFAQLMAPTGDLVGKTPPAHPNPALPLDAYVGRYVNTYYGPATVTVKNGVLLLAIGKTGKFTLRHWDGNAFSLQPSGENAPGLTSATFTPASTAHAAALTIDYLNANGLGTFIKT